MMCLQQSKGTLSSSASILGHEMTHLVVNRFLPRRLPLWLNEGLAEYYGEFAYAAHKGIKKSKRAQFTRLGTIFPLEHLLDAKGYPVNTRDVQVFYQTSKYLVGFLLLAQPTEPFIPFVQDLLQGMSSVDAFAKHYQLGSVPEIEKKFRSFAR